MRPPKISRDDLLLQCASTFKRLGYHGTTMDTLAAACGLTKASFYHHYPNKESLLRDVLDWTHKGLAEGLFAITADQALSPAERLETMGRRAMRLFQGDAIGCLMGVVAVDASYGKPELMAPVRAFFDDWAAACALLFKPIADDEQARELGQQMVADYEGAILLARIYNDPAPIERVTRRALALLAE
ncbi:TetR/AcrR family transcriptional regulator [Pseudomonas putida]|uniref:HTH tetR-type domain-containing protein n=1 Tax=Pseudomonas putida TaxID=303 RepID=A0A1Q9RA98_PSEPU|nr:TetR/AcrR family transcriptional regulator [Pseudomonas putida]OLS64288.1 hypothetical protein PSEMO_08330 [Pseudomonas putida]